MAWEKRTVFGRLEEKGRMHAANEETSHSLFLAASHLLGEGGYIHCEVSNYARTEARFSRHNCKYWEYVPYLGLGPSAHSFDGNDRWWNIRSIRRYGALLDTDLLPVEGRETLTEEQVWLESLSLGFRTREGVLAGEAAPTCLTIMRIVGVLTGRKKRWNPRSHSETAVTGKSICDRGRQLVIHLGTRRTSSACTLSRVCDPDEAGASRKRRFPSRSLGTRREM